MEIELLVVQQFPRQARPVAAPPAVSTFVVAFVVWREPRGIFHSYLARASPADSALKGHRVVSMLFCRFLQADLVLLIYIVGLVHPKVLLESQGRCRTRDSFLLLTLWRLVGRHQRCCCAEWLVLAELEWMQAAESVCLETRCLGPGRIRRCLLLLSRRILVHFNLRNNFD